MAAGVGRGDGAAPANNPASPIQARLAVDGGPSAVVDAGGRVAGSFTVSEPCTATVVRVDVAGGIIVLAPPEEIGSGTRGLGRRIAATQSGLLRLYALLIAGGLVVIVVVFLAVQ